MGGRAAVAKLLAKSKGLGHRHLANVLDVLDFEGRQFVVSEQLRGETLSQRLAEIGHKAPVDAVRSALRVADALSSLHEASGAHGTVHPNNVVLTPEGRDGPVLVFGPLASRDAAFRQPEWEPGDAPSEPDDSWGAAALLFLMLVGEPPARAGYESESALADAGVFDPVLRVALYHALARDLGRAESRLASAETRARALVRGARGRRTNRARAAFDAPTTPAARSAAEPARPILRRRARACRLRRPRRSPPSC